MIAFGQAVRNLARIRQASQQPESTDALQVLDTQVNLGAASSQAAQSAGEKAVKQPSPEYKVTFGPNGEPLVEAKNVPLTAPTDQVKQAEAGPFAHFAETLRKTLDQSANVAESLPNPESIDGTPDALAHELGVEKPALGRDGLLGYASRLDSYDKVLGDHQRLKQMVAAQRLKRRMDVLGEGAGAYGELAKIEQGKRAETTEKRTEQLLLKDLVDRNPLGYGTPDKHISAVESVLQRKMDEGEKAQVYAAHAEANRDRAIENAKQERAAAKEKRDEAAAARAEAKLDALLSEKKSETLAPEDLDYIIEQQDKGATFPVSNDTEKRVLKRRREKGVAAPIALSPHAQTALAKNNELRVNTQSLMGALTSFHDSAEGKQYWDTPFAKWPDTVKYNFGVLAGDDLGKLQSKFEIQKWAGTIGLIPGIRRGDIIEKVSKHQPQFDKDSPALMYDKLKNADEFYAGVERSVKQYGAKSGVVQSDTGAGAINPDRIRARIEANRKKGKK